MLVPKFIGINRIRSRRNGIIHVVVEGFKSVMESALTATQKEIIVSIGLFQGKIRDEVRRQLLKQSSESLSEIVGQGAGDVTYRIDAHAEEYILQFGKEFSKKHPCILISEGIGTKSFPEDSSLTPEYRILIDPIDGTREIMHDKRSAWVLTGIAKNKGNDTNFSDIEVSVMTEIPPTKQNIGSIVWAVNGHGAYEEDWDLEKNKFVKRRKLQSSRKDTIRHGFVVFADYGRGSKEEVGRLADRILDKVLGKVGEGQLDVFNDQYMSAGAQLHLVAGGKYLFVADLRPEIDKVLMQKGRRIGLAAHPYDITPFLIAQEAGAIVTDEKGQSLSFPLDTETNCNWIIYANTSIRSQIEPVLLKELKNL